MRSPHPKSPSPPPRILALLISFLLPASDRRDVLGALEELYADRVRERGAMRARWWYARQAAGFAWRLPAQRFGAADRIRADVPAPPITALGRLSAWLRRLPSDLRIDLRFAARQLARSPLFTLVSVLSLAVGIGVVVAGYALYDATILRTPPFPDADRLLAVYTGSVDGAVSASPGAPMRLGAGRYGPNAFADLDDLAASGVFESVAAHLRHRVTIGLPESRPRTESATFVSSEYFATLAVRPARGRWPNDGRPEIAIAHWVWERLLDSTPDVLGGSVRVNGADYAIVGVAPPWFHGPKPGGSTAAWLPATAAPTALARPELLTDRRAREFDVIGRLSAQLTREAGVIRLEAIAASLAEAYPAEWRDVEQRPLQLSALTLRESVVPPSMKPFFAILVTTAAILLFLVLALACTNVAGLLLARALARRHEIAVRLTLGASSFRVIRQLLTESLLLALLGGATGAILAFWQIQLLERDPSIAALRLEPDLRVAAAVLVVSGLSAMLFGLVPAIQAIRDTGRAGAAATHTADPRTGRLRSAVIATQVAVSFVLLLFASFALRGARAHLDADLGFDDAGLFVIDPATHAFVDTARTRAYVDDLVIAVQRLPGVRHFAQAEHVTFGGSGSGARLTMPDDRILLAGHNSVDGEYFQAIGIPLLRGRFFDESDAAGTPPVAVINRALADSIGPGALGRVLEYGSTRLQIIGIVDNVATYRPGDVAQPHFYRPLAQTQSFMIEAGPRTGPQVWRPTPKLLVRMSFEGDGIILRDAVERALEARYPDAPPPSVETLRDLAAAQAEPQRAAALGALAVGTIELLLAAIGLYGILAFIMLARTREIGIRLALGAAPHQAGWPVLRGAIRFALIGVALGALIGVPISRSVDEILVGARAADPIPFLIAAAAILLATALASLSPAIRAARVQPGVALRHE